MSPVGPQMQGVRRAAKAPGAFRTISEVSEALQVPQHVLRFWESKFTQVRPLKRGGGRRYYRPEDVSLLRTIRGLLYDDGYTIRGVQKVLREGLAGRNGERERGNARSPSGLNSDEVHQRLRALAEELDGIKALLTKARNGG